MDNIKNRTVFEYEKLIDNSLGPQLNRWISPMVKKQIDDTTWETMNDEVIGSVMNPIVNLFRFGNEI